MPEQIAELIAEIDPVRAPAIKLALERYVELIVEGNQHVRLTGGRTSEEIWPHIEDAIRAAIAFEAAGEFLSLRDCRVVDIGTGAGFPGLVWAILFPSSRVALVEATLKKSNFLEATLMNLGLDNATVYRNRAEELGRDVEHREQYDVACCRALGMLNVVAEWATPLVKVGGCMAFIKGASIDQEVADARKPFERVGGAPEPVKCPYATADGRKSAVYVYRKTMKTSDRFPRRGGKAARHPIS